MRILLSFSEYRLQFCPVGGNHLLLLAGSLDYHRHFIIVGIHQRLSPLKTGDGTCLRFGELQNILDIAGLVRLQVQNDLVLGVVDNGPAILAVLQPEEV